MGDSVVNDADVSVCEVTDAAVDAEITAVSDGLKVEFMALKLIKAVEFSVSDILLDLSEVKFGLSVSVLSWDLCVGVNIESVCDNCGMPFGVL